MLHHYHGLAEIPVDYQRHFFGLVAYYFVELHLAYFAPVLCCFSVVLPDFLILLAYPGWLGFFHLHLAF